MTHAPRTVLRAAAEEVDEVLVLPDVLHRVHLLQQTVEVRLRRVV